MIDINEQKRRIEHLSLLLEKTFYYAKHDPETFLPNARKAVESICKFIYVSEYGSIQNKMMLNEFINTFEKQKTISEKIILLFKTIQTFGNFGSHGRNNDFDELTRTFIIPCEASLKYITNWFFASHLKETIPNNLNLSLRGEDFREHKLENDENEIEALIEKALARYDICDYNGALKFLNQILKQQQTDAIFYCMRGKCKYHLESYKSAIKDFTSALSIIPNYYEAIQFRAKTKMLIEDNNGAISDFNIAISIKPSIIENYHDRGCIYLYLNRFNEALADFKQVLSLDPSILTAVLNCGVANFNLGIFQDSIHYYTQAINLNIKDENAYALRAKCYYEIKDHKSAIADYSLHLSIKPKDDDIIFERASTYFNLGDFMNAFNDYKSVTLVKSKNKFAFLNAGLCLYNYRIKFNDQQALANKISDYYNSAITWFETAIQIDPDYSFAYYMIAECFRYSPIIGQKTSKNKV